MLPVLTCHVAVSKTALPRGWRESADLVDHKPCDVLVVEGGRGDAANDEGKAPEDGGGCGGVGEDTVGGREGDGAVPGMAVADFDALHIVNGRHFVVDELRSKKKLSGIVGGGFRRKVASGCLCSTG